ncbi:MAG: hypothetical protein ACOVLJ_05635, partial [Ilumatobacteraceae bacterium]
ATDSIEGLSVCEQPQRLVVNTKIKVEGLKRIVTSDNQLGKKDDPGNDNDRQRIDCPVMIAEVLHRSGHGLSSYRN